MHIRQVLVKAELEKFQQYKDIYTALKKGKVPSEGQFSAVTRGLTFRLTPPHLFSFSSFAFHVETRSFLFSPGRTPVSSAKGKNHPLDFKGEFN